MARKPTMNHDRDQSNDGDAPKKSFYNPVIYKPLPDKAGSEVTNKIFVSLMAPYRWKLFNPTPEMVGLYGMVGSGNQLISVPNDLLTYSFKMPVHYVQNNGYVICPVAMNKYLTEVHGYGQLFDRPRCAHCEKSSENWAVYNKRWEDLGYDKERMKNLGNEEYRHIRDSDPVLKKAYSEARKYSPQTKYLIQVWDHDKFSGNRPMDEEQTQLGFQFWIAPEYVHKTLTALYKDEIEFYDATSETGVQIMNLVKDTRKCSGTNLSQTTYNITPSKVVKYPADWVSYLDNEEAWPDPFGQVNLMTYDEMKRSLLESQADEMVKNDAPEMSSRNVTPPMSKVVAPAVPTAPSVAIPPTQAAPMPPSSPVPPVAQAEAPTAPSAPVPMSPPTAPTMPNFGTAPMAPGMMPNRSGETGKRHNW